MREIARMAFLCLLTTPRQARPFSSVYTLSYVNKSVIPPPVHAGHATSTSPTSSSSRTSIHQSVLNLYLLPSLLALSMTSHIHIFSTVKIFFSKPSPLLHNYYFRPSLSSSSPFHQGILNIRQQNPL